MAYYIFLWSFHKIQLMIYDIHDTAMYELKWILLEVNRVKLELSFEF